MIFMNNYKFTAMKRVVIPVILISLIPVIGIRAQNPNLEKLNAYKIAFFTRRLNLTPREAEVFWPVYNEFQNKRSQIQHERQALNKNINQNELNMSEKEMIETGDKLIALLVQEAALAQEYHKKFGEVLSPVKVLRLYQAENQYRMQLLNELKDNKPLRNNGSRGPGNKPL